jgi:hypothetical protein
MQTATVSAAGEPGAGDPARAPGRMADRVHESMGNAVQATVRRIDSFFVTEDHATFEERDSRVRLRLDTDYLQHHGWEVSPRVKLHLVLPGLGERLRLVMNEDQGPDADEASTSDDDNDIALRWMGPQSTTFGYSFDVGITTRGDGLLDPFARVNTGVEYELGPEWVGQTTNRLYYYAKAGWRNDLRQYFNRGLGDDYLFRSRTRVQYFQDNGYNPFFEQKFSLFQSLDDTHKLAYEALYRRQDATDSPFDQSEITVAPPQDSYRHYIVQIRYRQQFWRPWFYVELWPIVVWPEERDYDTTLAFRFRMEVNLGGTGDERLDE